MRTPFLAALAASMALSQVAVSAAAAQEAGQPAPFRVAEARTFSSEELQRYGLDRASADHVIELQRQGYAVQLMTPQEAQAVYGGTISNNTWLMVGAIALVVIAVASID